MPRAARWVLVILADLGWGFLYTLAALGLAILAAQVVLLFAAAMASTGCQYDALISVHYHAAPRAGPDAPDSPTGCVATRPGPAAGPELTIQDHSRPQTPQEIIDELLEAAEPPDPAAAEP